MPSLRRSTVAALTLALIGLAGAPASAQAPPRDGKGPGQGAARGKDKAPPKNNRPARRKPRAPVGQIGIWPMPPALVIRQTPESHDEVRAFLNMLRYQ